MAASDLKTMTKQSLEKNRIFFDEAISKIEDLRFYASRFGGSCDDLLLKQIDLYISPVERPQENLKYAMRLFLVRLGFVGDEYKQARKILLRDLSGNCSWKAGHAPEQHNVADDSERRHEP